MLPALLPLVVVLCVCSSGHVAAAGGASAGTYSPWQERSSTFFDASTTPDAFMRVLAQADWYDDMSLNMVGTWANFSSPIMVWGDRGEEKRWRTGGNRFGLKWNSTLPSGTAEIPVVAALVADLRHRGKLDVLVQSTESRLYVIDGADPHHTLRPVTTTSPGDVVNVRLKHPSSPQLSLASVVAPCGAPDVVFVNELGQLVLLQLRHCTNTSDPGDDAWGYEASLLVHDDVVPGTREVLPFSLSQEDMDGDCVADLLFAVRDVAQATLQLFAYLRRQGRARLLLTLPEATAAVRGAGRECYGDPVFVSFDADRALDVVLPVCRPEHEDGGCGANLSGCTRFDGVRVFLNAHDAAAGCRDDATATDFVPGFTPQQSSLTELTFDTCGVPGPTSGAAHQLTQPLFMPSHGEAPLRLRSGDYNRDRLNDLVVPSSVGPLVLTAVVDAARCPGAPPAVSPCVVFTCNALDVGRAGALVAGDRSRANLRYRDATPFFSSVTESGRLDVVLTTLVATQSHGGVADDATGRVLALYQYMELSERHYFLLASALYPGPTLSREADRGRRSAAQTAPRHVGVVQGGAVHYLAWMDIHTHHHRLRRTQLAQTQAHALQPTHILVGLGETFSYVNGYTLGLVVDGVAHWRQWPSFLVPNSEVFAVLQDCAAPSRWHLQLYLPTSRYKLLLVVSLTVALVVLGVPVILLRLRELRQDFREWKMR